MKASLNPIRLFVEVIAIAAIAELGVHATLPAMAPGTADAVGAGLDALLLSLLAGPWVYWRCMAAARRAARALRPPAAPAGPRRVSRMRDALLMAVAAHLSGLALTGAGLAWLERDTDAKARVSFDGHFERLRAEVQRRLEHPFNALHGARGVYAASSDVTRTEFRHFVRPASLDAEFPGIRGLGFIQRVPRAGLDRFVATERADSAPDFKVHGSGAADDLFVAKFIEPQADNRAALGEDFGADATRRDAIEAAIDSGGDTLSERLSPVQPDAGAGAGFLYLVPVYRQGSEPATPQQRREALLGVAYAPAVAAELLAGADKVAEGLLDIELYEGAGTDARHIVHHLGVERSAADAAARSRAGAHAPDFVRTARFTVGGRELTLLAHPTAAFAAHIDRSGRLILGVGGALLSFLMALATWALAVGRVHAESLARRMTADLDRLAKVVQYTDNAVTLTDRDLKITWVNAGFTRITGYSLEEALGRTPNELLGSGKADPQVLQQLAAAAAAGESCRVEILNRARDGHAYWAETEIQPTFDDKGTLVGFMEIGSDVSARNQARDRLEAALRETDALLTTIHRHAIVSVADHDGRIIDVNDAFCRISGYRRDELIGQDHRMVNSGVQPREFWAEMWRTISSGQPWRGAICNRARDGSLYWVDSIIAPIVGAGDRVEKYVSIRTDISAVKSQARELAAERQRLDNILRGTNVGTWEWNVRTGETRLDARWARIVGWGPDALPPLNHQTWMDHVHPDDLDRADAELKRHFAGETEHYESELRLRHREGHWVWVLDRGRVSSWTADGRPEWMSGTHMDITPRKRVEAELRASRAFLDRAGRISGVGGWEIDLIAGTLHWSDQTCRIHDVEPGHQPDLDEALAYYPPAAQAQMRAVVRQAIDEGSSFDLELPMVTATGRAIWVHSVGAVEFVDGRAQRLVGAFQDVSARHEMGEELRRSHAMMRSILENLPCGLSVFGADGALLAHNARYRSLMDLPDALFDGATPDFERLAQYIAQREHGAGAAAEAALADAMQQLQHPVPCLLECRLQGGAALELRSAPMPGGGLVNTYTDISERKRVEAEARSAEAILRGAIDTVNEAFVLFDSDDRLVFANEKYRDLYATSADLIVPGARFEDIIRVGAQRGQYRAAIGRVDEWVAERMAAHRCSNTTLVQKLDSGQWLRIIERRMADGHIVGFRIDITDLMNATEAAQAASREKSRFLANMSHEIRTPMNAILGMLSLLQTTALTPRQADYASKTEGAARSLLGLLNDILDFSKVEAGKLALDPRPFGFERLLRDLSVILAANLGDKNVELLFDIDPAVPCELVADDLRLQQVLVNLAGNAIKFTEAGEVQLGVRVLEQSGDAVRLEFAVRDTGIGIAPEHQEQIFAGFAQAEATTTRRFGGTGLGLAICRRLVEMMGGELALTSTPGAGSRFSFAVTLPCGDAPAAAGRLPGRPLHVLFVDDHAGAREGFAAMARSLGWTAELAASSPVALERLEGRAHTPFPYDAVFVGGGRPGLDGWHTALRIRELAGGATVPVVMLVTAQYRERLSHRSAEEHAQLDGFIVKPLTAAMLADAVADARSARDGQHRPAERRPTPSARLAGLRLLVVEDNANNRQVAHELLVAEGAEVVLAHDGQEGVAALSEGQAPFDAVLMDLQMPVMDGFTATAQIRTSLGLHALPIIAMTANALTGDREASLAAGMNEHIGKPFDLSHLVDTLRRLTGRADTAAAAPPMPAPAPSAPPALLAQARQRGIELPAALGRLGGRADVYDRLVRSFIADMARLPEQLSGQLRRGQRGDAARSMHTLKGLAATLGAQTLARRAAQAERRLASDDAEPLGDETLRGLWDAISEASTHLAQIAAQLVTAMPTQTSPPSEGPHEPATLHAALARLAELLGNSDMAALESFRLLRLGPGAHLGDRLRELDAAIASLDFERARSLCRELDTST